MVKATQFASLEFVKTQDESYFELLRLARVSQVANDQACDLQKAINLLNQLPLFSKIHKRIIPLLNNKAHKLDIFNKLTPESQQLLTTITQQGVITELARKQQLMQIIEALSVHNIPLILLKGAAFSEVLYTSQAPRTSNDLDILIQKKHWQQAVAVIKTVMNYTEKPQPNVFGDLYELSFSPTNKIGAALDLHSSLTHPLLFTICEKQLWNSSVEHPSYKHELVRVLSPEHALIHQAIHAYKDMDFAKYNLVDAHEIISTQAPNIKNTIAIAKAWGTTVPLYVLLKNCSEVMHSNIDTGLLKRIKPRYITYKCIKKLVKSRFNQPINNTKPLRYRVNQILGQFVFTSSVVKPLALQWLFLSSFFKQNLQRQ
jgi:hypothetical protein